jgi:hypothetical protein
LKLKLKFPVFFDIQVYLCISARGSIQSQLKKKERSRKKVQKDRQEMAGWYKSTRMQFYDLFALKNVSKGWGVPPFHLCSLEKKETLEFIEFDE